MINLLNAKNHERNKFLSNYIWVVVCNWSDKPISLNTVIDVYAQAWEEGESGEDALMSMFPDEYQEIEVVCSDFPEFDFIHKPMDTIAYYMGELFEP
jgi:hypothetical protein